MVSLQRLLSTVIYSLIKHEHKDIKYSPTGLDHNAASQRVTDLIRYGSFIIFHTLIAFFLDIKHSHDTRLASGSSYSIPKIRTNYGKFNIRFIGAKIWNSLSESAKKLTKIGFKVDLKNGIIQQYSNFS